MTIQDTVGVYDQTEFADNPEARCSIVLILDVSGSMAGVKIDTVNQALVKFRDIIREDSVTALRADVAIIAFDDVAWVAQDFTNGMDFEPPLLTTRGETNYSEAINLALDLIEARKQSYRDGGIAYYRSLAYFLTDGLPEDNPEELARTAARLAKVEANRGVAFFSFIIEGAGFVFTLGDLAEVSGVSMAEIERSAIVGRDAEGMGSVSFEKVAMLADISEEELVERGVSRGVFRTPLGELSKLAPAGRPPVELSNMAQLEGSIQWLSRSAAAVSQSQPGDSIRLPERAYLDF